jgi:hypothetical protein
MRFVGGHGVYRRLAWVELAATVIFALPLAGEVRADSCGDMALEIAMTRVPAAGSCGDMALEIAMSSKLESGGLSKDGTFISLTGEPYGAYLYCSGPAGMSLRYVGPRPPPEDWYAFVSKTGSVLTKRPQPIIRSVVERCIREATKSSHVIEIMSDGFDVLCGSEEGNPYFELVVTQRLKPPPRERR